MCGLVINLCGFFFSQLFIGSFDCAFVNLFNVMCALVFDVLIVIFHLWALGGKNHDFSVWCVNQM